MKELFRKSALDSTATPEQLNQQNHIIRPHMWMFFVIFIVAFISVGSWVIAGNVTDTITMKGIVFPQLGVEIIFAEGSGTIKDVLYQAGEEVSTGDILAVISNEALLQEIESVKQTMEYAKGEEKEKLEKELTELQNSYEYTSIIRATKDGMIQSMAAMNEKINEGDKVASILINNQASNNRQVVAYIPLITANKLEVGMEAQINPGYASREEYGYMKGYISEIGTMPVTSESLEQHYGNLEYVKDILPDSSCVEIYISLYVDEESENMFKWSNEKGKNLVVDIGTICDVQIVTKSRKPYELLF